MDYGVFTEQLVQRRPGMRARLIQSGIAVLALVLIVLLALIPGLLYWVPVLLAAIILFAVILIRRQNVEFEYIQNGDSLDVDKILAKSARTNITTVDLKAVEFFGEETRTAKQLHESCQTVFDCAGDDGVVYSIVYLGEGDEGRCALLFTPNEKMLTSLKRVISPRIWKK